jgi:tetratricopeptide (TPR) repeat protein
VGKFKILQGPSVENLREYVRTHSLEDRSATLSRFVTFGLVAGPPPKFEPKLRREELPPDVIALDGFRDVLANFYQETGIDVLWRESQPRYEQSIAQLREPLTKAVLASSGYLREVVNPGQRSFNVYVEPLVGGQVHVRNIGDEYALVTSPTVNSFDEMRHAYLHFLLDPLVIRYRDKLLAQDPLFRTALRAPRLPDSLRKDSLAYFDECLVKSVELRLRKLSPEQLKAEVDSLEKDGYVVIRPLMGALEKFEKSEPAMSYYFPDLLQSIDVTSERLRVQNLRFAPADTPVVAEEPPAPSEKDLAIQEGDRLTASRDAAGAAAAYEKALAVAPNDPRALYGYAVASLMLAQGQRAFDLFTQVVAASGNREPETRPDPETLSWSHVYLGRMHDIVGERDEAVAEYQAALAVAGAPEGARAAAQKGVQEAYQPAVRNPPPG